MVSLNFWNMEVINDMKPFIQKIIFQILKGLVMSEAKLSNFDHANSICKSKTYLDINFEIYFLRLEKVA